MDDGKGGALLLLRVHPGAQRNQIEGPHGISLKVRIKAPPVDGKANKELLKFLSRILRIRIRELEIVRGLKGREKTIRASELSPHELSERLTKWVLP